MISKLLDAFNLSSLARWKIPPAKDWYSKGRDSLISSGIYWPFHGLFLCLSLLVFVSSLNWFFTETGLLLTGLQTILTFSAFLCAVFLLQNVQKNLIVPLTHVRHWAIRMRGGNLIAKIPLPNQENEFSELAKDINCLSDELKNLTNNMKEQVNIQSRRTAQKSNSLAILYDVAKSINQSKNLDELLSHFLHTLQKLTRARGGTVRILTKDKTLRLVAQTGFCSEAIAAEKNISIDRCLCGDSVKQGAIKTQPVKQCEKLMHTSMLDDNTLTTIAVPMMYRGKCLGIYNLYVSRSELNERDELSGLLTSIGQNLGIAIAKQNLETQARRVALMEERNFLSHELHDSLAQTLVSLKFQTQLLKDTIEKDHSEILFDELNSLDRGLDKANVELRDLLDHFRITMDERGLIPAISDLCANLQSETGINCYFQNQSNNNIMPPDYEIQVLHIVQEALSNIRKHSKAKNARVVIQEANKHWKILIEDDGIGMKNKNEKSRPGENIGLAIMRERAQHLQGELAIEAEENEGTRIELRLIVDDTQPVRKEYRYAAEH